jgi:membrane-associated protease RseP (regulator of RpoE activity)
MSESVRHIPSFSSVTAEPRRRRVAAPPTAREWARHITLFFMTALTATWAGTMSAFWSVSDAPQASVAPPVTPLDYLLFIPREFLQELGAVAVYAFAHPGLISEGAVFALALLTILLAHEAGHYIACRLYGVDATLPFFIPMPPPFMAGTLGAFIKIKSPIPSRRALFDIGVAGPLAGFVAIIPVAIAGLLTATPLDTTGVIRFNDPLFMQLLAAILGVGDLANVAPNPFYFAAWIGLLVTSLNLMPVGQLDGGHAVYALFGARAHRFIGRVAFLFVVTLAPLGWLWHGAPTGIVYAILLFVLLRLRHPQAENEQDIIGRERRVVALLTLLVFLLSFMPFPLTVI